MVIYVFHLRLNKNYILPLFIREEMFVKILTKWPFQAAKKIIFELVFEFKAAIGQEIVMEILIKFSRLREFPFESEKLAS